jgi:HTH-type transcriptional regulator/antitoxin HigA
MNVDSGEFRTPGQLISALLEQRGWSKRVFAVVLDVDESSAGRIISDKRAIDAELALTLEELFGVPAERFLDLQKSYDLAKARLSARADPERATRAHLYGGLPVSDMIKRGWITADDVRDPRVQSGLMRFFGVDRVEDIEVLPHAAKKTQVNTVPTPAQLAWLYRVKQIAADTLVARYSPAAVRSAIGKLKSLLSAPEETRKVPRILAESGIRFLLVESLPATKIDGVCFWLNGDSPVIAMTMRYDRIDNFWFVLRHELEHVDRQHGMSRAMLDAELEGQRAGVGADVGDDERVANEAAAEFCVPKKMMEAFVARKAPFFNERDIIGFARTIKVHPGLVAGQLRHRLDRYDRFGNHLVKVRSFVAPGAIVDGWGDVAPVGA